MASPTEFSSLVPPLRQPPRSERSRRDNLGRVPHGRYDARKTPLPPGGELGPAPPQAAIRAKQQKRLKGIRKALVQMPDTAAEQRLRDEEKEIVAALAGDRGDATAIAAIIDPLGDGEERIQATVNRHVDVLEEERSLNLISEAAYRNGRTVQGILERAGRIGGSNWAGASRKDPAEVRDTHAQRMVDDGRVAEMWRRRIRDRLGMIDARLVDRVLADGISYEGCAALIGRSGDRGRRYIAARFRDALEDLSEVLTAKGKVLPPPDDKYLAMTEGCSMRQAAALAGAVTEDRLQAELEELTALKVKTVEIRRDIAWLQERIEAVRQAKAGRSGGDARYQSSP